MFDLSALSGIGSGTSTSTKTNTSTFTGGSQATGHNITFNQDDNEKNPYITPVIIGGCVVLGLFVVAMILRR